MAEFFSKCDKDHKLIEAQVTLQQKKPRQI